MTGKKISLAIALALAAAVVLAQLAGATHPRPRGATPLRVSLVPAYRQCTSPNSQHQGSVPAPSCVPPVQESSYLTVGTPDANGAGANSVGSLLIKIKATVAEDVLTTLTITDVRCKPGTDASVCNSPNTAAGPDYSGQIQADMTIRISDHYNGPNLNEAATVRDLPNPITANCVNTSDPSVGGTCSATACATCIGPPRDDIGGQRSVIEFASQVEVRDGGADGVVSTAGDTPFMRGGVFIP